LAQPKHEFSYVELLCLCASYAPLTATLHNCGLGKWKIMFAYRSLVGQIEGLRYAVRLNDFKLDASGKSGGKGPISK
jgi:hypothetical protein